ncbi:hypothetical protein [Micromonospora sp. CB01531]|uniref:hypothetical protein n=1 Tax=Micromonospora sp. CB01531 TaxID=1718947 RepID=UPI000967088F|nr:hypothetical protein A6A27_21775 [Micromonospora sp. CB01531]
MGDVVLVQLGFRVPEQLPGVGRVDGEESTVKNSFDRALADTAAATSLGNPGRGAVVESGAATPASARSGCPPAW